MYQQQVNLINTIKMLFDALSIITGAYCAYYGIINFYPWMWSLNAVEFITSILLVMFVNNYIMGRFGLYSDRKHESYQQLLWALTKTVIIDFVILGAGMLIYNQMYSARLFYTYFLIISYIILVSERTVLRFFYEMNYKKGLNLRRILLVGGIERCRLVAVSFQKQLSWGHEIVGILADNREELSSPRTIGYINDLQDILRTEAIDEVIFALGSHSSIELQPYLKTCRSMGITTRILPALWTGGNTNFRAENYQGIPFLTFYENSYSASGLFYKRILDIVGGIVGTVIFSILYPFIALAIKMDSPGPVIFKQARVGQNGRIFKLYKFRSMSSDAESIKGQLLKDNEMKGAMFKITNDPRITKVGKWLRKTSIDEIPQFLNVLKGEMSLVGTRPPTPDEVKQYKDWHYRRISIKPGITGLWQISGRSEITDFDEIVELDCAYLANWRFLSDIKILFKTVWVIIQRKGAK
jgi:exopolysaccharide biosynthesis polyprenyl glycosylphosphotransferase